MTKVIEMRGICKSFGTNVANDHVDFDLNEGEIHALLGENGAGKTTLMNLLFGMYKIDEGSVRIQGEEVDVSSPSVAIDMGVGMVHQHFMLIPQLTATQNIFLGMKEVGQVLNLKELNKRVQDLATRYNFNIQPDMYVWQMPVGTKQKVEILKVLMRKAKILIMDEPTAVLTPQEADDLFKSIRLLADQGISVILITHKMNEVMEFCDRVTVMRQGRVVDTLNVCDCEVSELTSMMVGREFRSTCKTLPQEPGEVKLAAHNISVNDDKHLPAVKDLSFELRAGEILGVAGVDGNGQMELGEALVGLRPLESGSLYVDGHDYSAVTPRQMINAGLGHIPDDRQKKGLVMNFAVEENLVLGSQRTDKYCKGVFSNEKSIQTHADELCEQFDVRPRDTSLRAETLSGGNQQKVILARELARKPEIMLAIQPTRGLDVGATDFVHCQLADKREEGVAILLISTDLDEIRMLSDRIAVMYNGEFVGVVGREASLNQIGLLMSGVMNGNTQRREVVEEEV